jgi:hypothetical protein
LNRGAKWCIYSLSAAAAWQAAKEHTVPKMNCSRVVLGGLLAGLVINICGFLVDGLVLGAQWTAVLKSLGRPAMGPVATASFVVWVLALVEIVASAVIGAWLYKEPAAA